MEAALQGDEPLVQLAALGLLDSLDPTDRIGFGQRFLSHPLRALRIAVARVLLPTRDQLSERRRGDLDAAMEEYRAAQRFNSDRAEGLFNTASTLAQLGRLEEATEAFETTIERARGSPPRTSISPTCCAATGGNRMRRRCCAKPSRPTARTPAAISRWGCRWCARIGWRRPWNRCNGPPTWRRTSRTTST